MSWTQLSKMRTMLAAAGGAALGVAGTLAWQKWAGGNTTIDKDSVSTADAYPGRHFGDEEAPISAVGSARNGGGVTATDILPIPPTPIPNVTRAVGAHLLQQRNSSQRLNQESLPEIFKDLAGEDDLLEFSAFKQAMREKLQVSLGDEEIERVWSRLLSDRRRWSAKVKYHDEGDLAAKLTLEEFKSGVENVSFLRSCVQIMQRGKDTFVIPPDYDYRKTTNENYSVPAEEALLVGEYAAIRKKLDYSYHVHYSAARQLWQDRAIRSVVWRTEPQGSPWVVYTCGPMGAGKGFVLSWMSRNKYFPLEDIVCIDPDHFKKMMPEWNGYVQEGADAGSKCHRESGMLQEIAQQVAMHNSQNIWIDGSLRDGPWFEQVFKSIRRRFPHYKIAIFEIGASEHVVRQRIKSRACKEGRDIPEDLIVQSLQSVAGSLNVLTPLADFVARIGNNEDLEHGGGPQLRAFIRVDASGEWSRIQRNFARHERAGDDDDVYYYNC